MEVVNEGASQTVSSGGSEPVSSGSGSSNSAAPAAGEKTSASSAASSVAKDTSSSTAASDAGVDGGTESAAQAAEYKANHKYKVLKEEKEFPEWAKPLITSAEIEKNFRENFEKADGLGAVSQHRDILVKENQEIRETWGPFVQECQQAISHRDKGDLDSFFESVGIPEEAVLKYALYRLELKEREKQFPGTIKAAEDNRRLSMENQTLNQRLQEVTTSKDTVSIQQRESELAQTMARPEIQATVTAFDTAMGTPGSFRSACIREGRRILAEEKRDANTEEIVSGVLRLISWNGQKPAPAQVASVTQITQPSGTAGGEAPAVKPTLPNLKGRGTSPAKKVFKSTDDLRKHARTLRGARA